MARQSAPGSAALAPVRRWVLYSPWRLGGLIVAAIVVLVAIGHLTNSGASQRHTPLTADGGAAPSTTVRMLTAGQEVSADDATAVSDLAQARKSPQLMAMKWAVSYLDISATTGQWLTQLTALAPAGGLVSGDVVSSRPTYPVSVTGTTSTAQGGRLVVVPTSVGDLTVHLDYDTSGWAIATPLPALDGAAPPTTSPTTDTEEEEEDTATTPPPTTTTTTTPAPPPATRSTTVAPTTRAPRPAPAPAPRPRPGPIPVPTLDGPLPA